MSLAVAVTGVALLTPGSASAAPPAVTFAGGCGLLGLASSSHPDVSSLSVRTGDTVRFVNRLGKAADLLVDQVERASVPAGFEVAVTFTRSAEVRLVPECLVPGGRWSPIEITVAAPSGSPSATSGSPGPTGTPRASTAPDPSSRPATLPAPVDPPVTSPGSPSGAPVSPSRPALAGASPTRPATSSSALSSLAPGPSGSADPAAAFTGSSPVDPAVAVGSAVPATPDRQGPAGVLVLIAVVCVVGVSVAAIRAIIAQRAIRAVSA